MSKIFVVTGSSRKNSNSNAMAEAFMDAARAEGHEVKSINATRMNLNGCHGCNTCYKTGKACSFDDDFNLIADDLLEADGWVFSFPVYWFSIPGQTKCILDNTFSFFVAGKDAGGKKIAVLATAGDSNISVFDGAIEPFEKACELTGWELVGTVLVGGINEAGAIAETDGCQRAAELAKLF